MAITRLTVLKSLCREPEVAHRFVASLARRTYEAMEQPKSSEPTAIESSHRQMMVQALDEMDAWLRSPDETTRRTLSALHGRMRDEHRNIPFGAVRLITDANLLLFEYALSCVLAHRQEVGTWAYQTARQYAERYTPSEGTGLISASIPFVRGIIDFWTAEYDLSSEPLAPRQKAAKAEAATASPAAPVEPSRDRRAATFTARQGQFLAFIHLYRKLHRRGPAESDLRAFFGVTAPAAHAMVVKLEELGLITREPGVARSMRVAVPAGRLPELEATDGPPW
ncbi:MAG TPA: helix-turn-helix domain-containing protein [Gemmata sp.]